MHWCCEDPSNSDDTAQQGGRQSSNLMISLDRGPGGDATAASSRIWRGPASLAQGRQGRSGGRSSIEGAQAASGSPSSGRPWLPRSRARSQRLIGSVETTGGGRRERLVATTHTHPGRPRWPSPVARRPSARSTTDASAQAGLRCCRPIVTPTRPDCRRRASF